MKSKIVLFLLFCYTTLYSQDMCYEQALSRSVDIKYLYSNIDSNIATRSYCIYDYAIDSLYSFTLLDNFIDKRIDSIIITIEIKTYSINSGKIKNSIKSSITILRTRALILDLSKIIAIKASGNTFYIYCLDNFENGILLKYDISLNKLSHVSINGEFSLCNGKILEVAGRILFTGIGESSNVQYVFDLITGHILLYLENTSSYIEFYSAKNSVYLIGVYNKHSRKAAEALGKDIFDDTICNYVSIWNINEGLEVNRYSITESRIQVLAVSNDGSNLLYNIESYKSTGISPLSTGKNIATMELNLSTGKIKKLNLTLMENTYIANAKYSSDSKILMLIDNLGIISLYNEQSLMVEWSLKPFYDNEYTFIDGINNFSKIVLLKNGRITIWNTFRNDDTIASIESIKITYETNTGVPYYINKGNIVIDKIQSSLDQIQTNQIISVIQKTVIKNINYKLVEQKNIDALLKQIELSYTGFYDESDRLVIGKFLQAETIILGNISYSSGKYILSIKHVDIETAQILSVISIIETNFDLLITKLEYELSVEINK